MFLFYEKTTLQPDIDLHCLLEAGAGGSNPLTPTNENPRGTKRFCGGFSMELPWLFGTQKGLPLISPRPPKLP